MNIRIVCNACAENAPDFEGLCQSCGETWSENWAQRKFDFERNEQMKKIKEHNEFIRNAESKNEN